MSTTLTGARRIHEYEMTGAQKKIDAYKPMDSQKTRELRGDECAKEN